MPRKNLIRSTTLPYHVTARANNRDRFFCSLTDAWKTLNLWGFEAQMLFGAEIHALTLMPNHFHMLITTPEPRFDLGVVMERLMRSVTKTVNLHSGRSGRVFGAPYHWTLVDSTSYFRHALKYVYRNPVRASLCARVEDYEFSTLPGMIGDRFQDLPLHYPYGMGWIPGKEHLQSATELLSWLNRPSSAETEEFIRKAFKRNLMTEQKQTWKRQAAADILAA